MSRRPGYTRGVTRGIVIIGGGIVGSALAAFLSENDGLQVTVLEAGPPQRLVGSTGQAPGFHGLLNEAAVVTELARASAEKYERIRYGGRAGFDRVGGLELASTPAGMVDLERRAALAKNRGLPARVLDPGQAASAAPDLVDPGRCAGGVLYPHDGTARADVVTAALRDRAAQAGVQFVHEARVTAIETHADRVTAARTATATFPADDVVVACGIWGPAVLALVGQLLPLTPVAHPYLYGPAHGKPRATSPFVRWPEQHVYARDHGDRFGLGTYDHMPIAVGVAELGTDAEQAWVAEIFDPAVAAALDLLPSASRFIPERRLNGVFSMTPDNLPLLGPMPDIEGLWVAEALWVTHACGAARALARLMTDGPAEIQGLEALAPDRFAGRSPDELTERALRLYRDIYAAS